MNRFFISAAHKSSGKTTVSMGLAAALSKRGMRVAAFKKGPDYIDPMWLRLASGHPVWNLDFFTMSREEILTYFRRESKDAEIALVEGNKGLHDGLDVEGRDSSAALANVLGCPVVLVLDVSGITRGVVPLIEGHKNFVPKVEIAGIILNRIGGTRQEQKLRAAIDRYTDLPVLGAIRRNDELRIEEHHLGLVPGNEHRDASRQVDRLADQIETDVDIDCLLELTVKEALPNEPTITTRNYPEADLKIGISQDAAFGFYYPDDLTAFQEAGAELVPIDTLKDAGLPAIDGLFLGGGFPERFIESLCANASLRRDIRQFITDGGPTYAECGGLMYLSRSIRWNDTVGEMVGAIPADTIMDSRPVGRGYVSFVPRPTHPWPDIAAQCRREYRGHEFHYSRLDNLHSDLERAWNMTRGFGVDGLTDGIVHHNVLGTYLHQRNLQNNPWVGHFLDFVRSCRSL